MSKKYPPQKDKRNVLITAALPYVNNVPHLGNIIGCVLSADVFARYCKGRGYNTLYIGGTDEYGTATETKARQLGLSPQEVCKKYWEIHRDVYKWFDIDFNFFGRTSTPKQTEIAQKIFLDLHKNNLLKEKTVEQFYCNKCKIPLADRYITGTCPYCKYVGARGDQCDGCSKLINAINLIEPKCSVCGSKPELKKSQHLFIDLPSCTKNLEEWVKKSISEGNWSGIAKSITESWIVDGVKERCITRDLKWGTPVPLEKFKDKVFYVWFDAPIGYISITANYTDDWELWWKENEYKVDYYQFLAKDNVPFHSIIFPSTLIGTGEKWRLVNGIRSTHYLNYENTKFSKSNSVGVFGDQAKDTNIPVEVWRYYLLTNRPEQSDTQFFWDDLAEKNNNELLKNLGNFVNRGLKFLVSAFEKKIPKLGELTDEDKKFIESINKVKEKIIQQLEAIKIKDGLHTILQLSRLGNVFIQDNKPWKLIKNNKSRCETVVNLTCQLVYDVAQTIRPYLPSFSKKVFEQLNLKDEEPKINEKFQIDSVKEGHEIGVVVPIFSKISTAQIKEYKRKFGGTQK